VAGNAGTPNLPLGRAAILWKQALESTGKTRTPAYTGMTVIAKTFVVCTCTHGFTVISLPLSSDPKALSSWQRGRLLPSGGRGSEVREEYLPMDL